MSLAEMQCLEYQRLCTQVCVHLKSSFNLMRVKPKMDICQHSIYIMETSLPFHPEFTDVLCTVRLETKAASCHLSGIIYSVMYYNYKIQNEMPQIHTCIDCSLKYINIGFV